MEVLVKDNIVVGFVVDGDINDERSVDVLSLAAAVEPKVSLVFLLLLILNQMNYLKKNIHKTNITTNGQQHKVHNLKIYEIKMTYHSCISQ